MQILKDNVRNSIIKYAEEEFLEKGFTDASLRTIAARVGISVSTIYSYYKNKDELMTAVCRPFIDSMMQITKERHSESTTLEDMMDIEKQQETAKLFISFVTKYRDIIRLILYKSEGKQLPRQLYRCHHRAHSLVLRKDEDEISAYKYRHFNVFHSCQLRVDAVNHRRDGKPRPLRQRIRQVCKRFCAFLNKRLGKSVWRRCKIKNTTFFRTNPHF